MLASLYSLLNHREVGGKEEMSETRPAEAEQKGTEDMKMIFCGTYWGLALISACFLPQSNHK